MKKQVINVFLIILAASLITGCAKENNNIVDLESGSDCDAICTQANIDCPSLIDKNICTSKCRDFSQETKDHLSNAGSCEALTQKPELISQIIIPEMNEPEEKIANNDCESACGNYVSLCLTLVPNAGQELFDEGYSACVDDCANWEENKTQCILTSFNCESMTDTCGL